LIVQQGGFLVIVDEWGDKRLAYEIKKKSRGYYVRLDFCGTGALVNEMERFFRIDERVLKYMTVLLDKDADVEKIKDQMSEAEAEASKEQAAQDTTASDDESTVATNDKLNDSEPEDKQDQPEISESQAVESETTQTESNEEEK
jgi:small subunit ribosomal protein S6